MPICDDATSPAETHRLRAPPAAARSEARTDRVGGGSARRPQAEHASWGGHPCYAAGRQVAQVNRVEHAGVFDPDEVLYLHDDHLGSTSVVRGTDTNGLPVTETRDFTSFGEVVTPSSPTPSPDWTGTGIMAGFTGHQHDAELGLVNMRGRIYDPRLGRFVTADPFVTEPLNSQGLNRYAYVQNNPVNYVDPSGFECTPVWCVTDPEQGGEAGMRVCGMQCSGGGGSGGGNGSQDQNQSSQGQGGDSQAASDRARQQAEAEQGQRQAQDRARDPSGGWGCPTCYNPQTAPRGPSPNGNPSELGTGAPKQPWDPFSPETWPTSPPQMPGSGGPLGDPMSPRPPEPAGGGGGGAGLPIPIPPLLTLCLANPELCAVATGLGPWLLGKALGEALGEAMQAKETPQFIPPTNPPQPPPATLPPGHSVRVMPPTAQYPSGYWVQTNKYGQPVDPSTGKPPGNVTRPEARARTHVPLP